MPIIVDATTTTTTSSVDYGLISFLQAKRLIARAVGGEQSQGALEEAGDSILQALEELNARNWEFLQSSTTLSLVASTRDYSLPANFKKEYDVRLVTQARPLVYVEQRDYDRLTYQQTSSTPYGYSTFRSSTAEAASPQHSVASMRFYPTPSAADTATVLYYRMLGVIDSDGDTLDLPRRYQYWPVYQGKAMLLNEHGQNEERAAYWQRKADRLFLLMQVDDQNHPDDDSGFRPARLRVAPYDFAHPYFQLTQLDGF